jgi:cytochrome c553
MKGMVATLSDQDIEDIATYYAGLPTKLDTLKGHIQGD